MGEASLHWLALMICGCVASVLQAAEVQQLKPIYVDTTLVEEGRPLAKIVVATSPELRAIAEQIRTAVKEASGVELPLVSDRDISDDGVQSENTIVVGNAMNNRVIRSLYFQYYAICDGYYPGRGGHVLLTISDPWGKGTNVILVGGSNTEGTQAASRVLMKRIPKGPSVVLPRLTDRRLAANVEQAIRPVAEAMLQSDWPWPSGGWYGKAHVGLCGFYAYLTGDVRLIAKYRERLLELVDTDPAWVTHGFNHRTYITYDLLEEEPVFSDADRLKITQALLRVLDSAEGIGSGYGIFPRGNHPTRAWMDNFFGVRYFAKYYHLPEAEGWMKKVDAFFAPHQDCSKPYEDSNGHSWGASLDNIATYALASGHFEFFNNGMIRRAADRLVVNTNNIGSCALVGCCGAGISTALLSKAAFYYQDPSYYYLVGRMPDLNQRWIWAWDPTPGNQHHCDEVGWPYFDGRPSSPPERLRGITVAPVEKAFYENICGGREEDFPRAYDKISFRSGFDPEDEYLLLDGLSGGHHSYDDANTILEVTACGRLWLNPVHMEYGPTNLCDFNGVMVLRDGKAVEPPRYSTLRHRFACNDLGFVQTAMENLGDTDWLRNVFWLPRQGFVVLDEVRFKTAGPATLGCRWYGFGRPKLIDRTLVLEQGNEKTGVDRFLVQSAGGETLSLTSEHSVEFESGRIAYALDPDDVPDERHRFQELVSGTYQVGEGHVFANLLWPVPSDSPDRQAEWLRTGPRDCALLTKDAAWRFGLLDEHRAMAVADTPVTAEAAAYALSSQDLYLVGAQSVTTSTGTRKWDQPQNLRIHLETGQADDGTASSALNERLNLAPVRPQLIQALARRHLVDKNRASMSGPIAKDPAEAFGPAPRVIWKANVGHGVLDLAVANLDGDGGPDVVVADKGGQVTAFSVDGTVQWQWHAAESPTLVPRSGGRGSVGQSKWEGFGPVNSISVFDVNGDGRPEIAAGSDDCNVYLLSADGKKIWNVNTPVRGPHDAWMSATSMAKKVVADDVDGDGRGEIAVGFSNSHVHLFDANGRERWHREMQYGTPMRLVIADTDGKAGKEIVGGCGFPSCLCDCHVFWSDGKQIAVGRERDRTVSGRRSLRAVVVADVVGDDGPEIVYGTDVGTDQVGVVSNQKPVADLEVGGIVRTLDVAELAGGVKPEILVGTDNGILSCFAGGRPAERLWYRSLQTGIRAVVVMPSAAGPRVIVGGEDGSVWQFDAAGKCLARTRTGAPIACLGRAVDPGHVIVAREDGAVERLEW